MCRKIVLLALIMAVSVGLITSCGYLIGQGIGKGVSAVANISTGALPQGSTEIGDFWITGGSNNTATIIRYIGDDKNVQIPSQIEGVNVTGISGYQMSLLGGGTRFTGAFQDAKLNSVIIPDSVTTIGNLAFADNELISITIGSSVASIGREAFARNNLTNISIPDSVTTIDVEAFANNRLTNVVIGNGVTSIGARAFANNQLVNVSIPNKVTRVGESIFISNSSLATVTIPFSSFLQADIAWGSTAWRNGISQNIIVATP